ncbi:uncharacterized protein LOC110765618 [Prunus avium]|uniref:Uncharacterized protein LOC110765618 n=1 Tax=Prunus avium TaxID=42229 RepID=A0A6P5TBM4_PRUAV|nr:uncharacterized protein LOC110765618 [Prunus avium]
MPSRSDMSDSQETQSRGSPFRRGREDEVVEQMYEAADKMGEEMLTGFDGNFEYRRVGGDGPDDIGRAEEGEVGIAEQIEVETAAQAEVGIADQGEVDTTERREVGTAENEELGTADQGDVGTANEGEVGDVWSADEYPSTITRKRLRRLREEYSIPSSIRLRAPTKNEKPSTPPLEWVTLCSDMLKQGVRLPLSPFLQEWIARLGVAPHQMNPNVYRTMVVVQALWRRVHGSEPTINQMLHCFLLKRSPQQVGFWYLQSAVGKMIESNPSSQKTWKPHWFYASGAWEFPEGAEPRQPRVQRRFRMPELERAHLSTTEHEQVEEVLALPSTERAADILLASEGLSESIGMRRNRNDQNMQAMLKKLAKGTSRGSAGGSQPDRVEGSPQMSVARSQVAKAVATPARTGQKRGAEEPSHRETWKRRAKVDPRRDTGKRPASSAAPELGKRVSVDPVTGPLEPWVDDELALSSFQRAAKRVLKVEVVERMFTEEMGYSGMTMSALEDQLKATFKLFVAAQNVNAHLDFDRGKRNENAVTLAELNRTIGEKSKVVEELELVRGRLAAEMEKNAELLSSVNKLVADKRGLILELSKAQKDRDEANQKVESFPAELRSCYDDAVKDYLGSSEYQEKLTAQRVEGYFDLIEKVGDMYPSLDWGFLRGGSEGAEGQGDQGGDVEVAMETYSEAVAEEAEPGAGDGVSQTAQLSTYPTPHG